MGGRHIVLRKIDGAEILRRVDAHGVTLMCAAPAVVAAVLDAAAKWDGAIPGRGTRPHRRRRGAAADQDHRARRDELGWEFIQIYGLTETSPLLTVNRQPRRVGRPADPRARRGWAAPARPPSASGWRSTPMARC